MKLKGGGVQALQISMQELSQALESLEPQIQMSEELRLKALKPLERMLALS